MYHIQPPPVHQGRGEKVENLLNSSECSTAGNAGNAGNAGKEFTSTSTGCSNSVTTGNFSAEIAHIERSFAYNPLCGNGNSDSEGEEGV